jgi:hypothetical protein
MAEAVYILCVLTSAIVAFLLLRAYRHSRARILLWTGVGFAGLCLNNVMLIIDRLVLPDLDLTVARTLPIVVGMVVMVFGLVWEDK